MKRILLICLLLLLVFMTGCDFDDNGIESLTQDSINDVGKATEKPTEEPTLEPDELNTDGETRSLELVIRGNINEANDIISDDEAVEWGAEVFQASGIELTKTITILDETFELEYLESVKLPLNGYPVHTYAVKGQQYAKVLFSAETGHVVEYVSIPIKVSYSTEEEYIGFIKNILGEDCDIDGYHYDTCTTWHNVISENGFSSTVEDGFHICGKNERWKAYSFYYDKYLDGIKTIEHITAEFFDGMFSMEIYDFDYEKEQFTVLMNKMSEFNDNIDSFLSTKTLKGYTADDFDVKGQVLFFREGKPYIKSVVEVRCVRSDDDGEIVQRVEIIAGLSEAEK